MTQLYNLTITVNRANDEDEIEYTPKDIEGIKSAIGAQIGANQDATSFVFVISRH